MLAVDHYYEVKTRRLFGPRESIRKTPGDQVVEIVPGDLVKCERLYSAQRIRYASLQVVTGGEPSTWVIERVNLSYQVPNWLTSASPLKILANAAE